MEEQKAENKGAVASVLDLAKAFERVSLWSGPGRRSSYWCCAATLSTRGECSSKDMRQSRSPTIGS